MVFLAIHRRFQRPLLSTIRCVLVNVVEKCTFIVLLLGKLGSLHESIRSARLLNGHWSLEVIVSIYIDLRLRWLVETNA